MMVSGNRVEDVRIVAGAVQCIPRRLHEAEDLVRGSDRSEEVAAEAGAVAVRGARTLNHNHFKVPLPGEACRPGGSGGLRRLRTTHSKVSLPR